MAEEIDLDKHNIFSTTEDAFEQFQANTSFEEEDYITLSDIVGTTNSTAPDHSNELCDIPYESEVVLASCTDINTQDEAINSTVITPSMEKMSVPETNTTSFSDNSIALDTITTVNTLEPNQTTNLPAKKKRGRKKKEFYQEQEFLHSKKTPVLETGTPSLSNNGLGLETTTTVSSSEDMTNTKNLSAGNKRGRKKKNVYDEQKFVHSRKTSVSETGISSMPNRDITLETVNTVSTSESINVNTTSLPAKNKRGRKKKSFPESEPKVNDKNLPDRISENVSLTQCEDELPLSIRKEKITMNKYGRKKNILKNSSQIVAQTMDLDNNCKQIDSNESGNKSLPITGQSIRKSVDEKRISSTKQQVTDITPRRRGRPKKSLDSASSTNTTNSLHEVNKSLSHNNSIKNTDTVDRIIDDFSQIEEPTSTFETKEIELVIETKTQESDDDISLSVIKQKSHDNLDSENQLPNDPVIKNNTIDENSAEILHEAINLPVECNIAKIISETSTDITESKTEESLLIEDLSKRPVRRKARKEFHYDEDSDEDPFANIELSDDEPIRKKGNKYYSDDEYIPGGKRRVPSPSSTDSEIELEVTNRHKKKKLSTVSPQKRGRKSKTENVIDLIESESQNERIDPNEDAIDAILPFTEIKAWSHTDEFENFLAKKIQGTQLKIKKVSSTASDMTLTPLEIPFLNAESKKTIEMSSQTDYNKTISTAVQTSSPYDLLMKKSISLTSEQSQKACEFLNNIVKTTAELGQLMTQKSEDFIKKKINCEHVTDTLKMDYCVRKSFLLFKLAKHNLLQMEEDLAKQYEEFLTEHNLLSCCEKPKKIEPTPKKVESDSDCEIVEDTISIQRKTPQKPKFNAKTVFLNKELSIKIAKKPSDSEKKLNIKGRNTVWINDSVLVKKVKTTQSFLAQDSRNKKPPDNYDIIEKLVSEFFEDYYRKKTASLCAPHITLDWLCVSPTYTCNYFVVEPNNSTLTNSSNSSESTRTNVLSNSHNYSEKWVSNINKINCPQTLSVLCIRRLQEIMFKYKNIRTDTTQIQEKYGSRILFNCSVSNDIQKNITDEHKNSKPVTLLNFRMGTVSDTIQNNFKDGQIIFKPVSLLKLSLNAVTDNIKNDISKGQEYCEPVTLLKLSLATISNIIKKIDNTSNNRRFNHTCNKSTSALPSLKTLCFKRLCQLSYTNNSYDKIKQYIMFNNKNEDMGNQKDQNHACKNYDNKVSILNMLQASEPKSLLTFSLECIQVKLKNMEENLPVLNTAYSLKQLTFDNIKGLIYSQFNKSLSDKQKTNKRNQNNTIPDDFTIGCINTMSEEAYQNLEDLFDDETGLEYLEENGNDYYSDEIVTEQYEEENTQVSESNWVSQVQMEVSSCLFPQNRSEENTDENIISAIIKMEPLDEVSENPIIVKSEPSYDLDPISHVPDHVVSKVESIESADLSNADDSYRRGSHSFDVDDFESFVATNKMISALDGFDNSQIYSQSALRVKRQHEPDYEDENDTSMSLLVPQTYEPLHIETAKGSLMESSSDNEGSIKKNTVKKKIDKRKAKQKKSETKLNNKDTVTKAKEKQIGDRDVAMLTRRMKDKIRQEEKKYESSDSETDTLSLPTKRGKKENNDKTKTDKVLGIEIQCNNIDSTEQISETMPKISPSTREEFTGFSAVDQNETANYEKYVKFVYDKILPSETDAETPKDKPINNIQHSVDTGACEINLEDPIELLECEPTLPMMFDDYDIPKRKSQKTKKIKSKSTTGVTEEQSNIEFTDRHGWQCYPINSNDSKLYLNAQIVLEKLPQSFVDTYLMYQNITDKDKNDEEIEKLTNLSNLNRLSLKELRKVRSSRRKINDDDEVSKNSRSPSPTGSDHCNELTPSEDEGTNVDDEIPASIPLTSNENCLAKDLLMNENDSDSEKEDDSNSKIEESEVMKKICKSKNKEAERPVSPDNLMLTADKMMNKELKELHAPVVINNDVAEVSNKHYSTRSKQKIKSKMQSSQDQMKMENDSSSEEEKQWVNTKEKLLKRMGKKEYTSADDAKRAKLVTEFIEKRGEFACSQLRRVGQGGKRRSKKFLEKQKQLRVLSQELLGDSDNVTLVTQRSTQSLYKGRRNIRKVIDKKSLARNTVIANMEEFERKRRLTARHNQLREILGCEEEVNVVVINDEVCLEYDFEANRPIVTIHQFFTKVMKAHQYEGVKFMWDACFESVAHVAAGRGGGGCILAHCMGLGKTLQVLALLHTVLTHPNVGMRRVLVCCPLSTVLNWVDEIHQWIGPVTSQIKVFELSKLKKTYERAYQLEDWYNGGGIFIIGYELFRNLTTLDPFLDDVRPTIVKKIRTALLDPGPDIVVCDEGHLLKNDCSVLAVAMSRVVTKRRIVLTGTPMQNNLREYYCMVNFVKPNLLGTYAEFSNRFENPIMNGQHRDSREEDIKLMKARTHILHKVLEGCLQRQEASVLYPYLPKKHEYTVFIPLTRCQWDLYKHYMNFKTNHTKQSVLKDFHILQKIWSHPQVLHNFLTRKKDEIEKNKVKMEKLEDDLAQEDLTSEDIKPTETDVWWLQYLDGGSMLDSLDSSSKFVTVFRILDECIKLGDKVLIFSTSLFCLDVLEYFLKKINKWSLGQQYYRLDGSVPAEVRQKWCREFNADTNITTKLFLISTRAGCLGLNMTAANRVIILDTSWNPAHDIQSIFRVYRFGQTKDCYIYRLVALGTMEQKIYERSVTKQAVSCRVVDEQQIDRHYNMAELTELYKFDEGGASVAGGVAVGVADVCLLRVARDTALHAVHEHDSLLRGSTERALPEHERHAAWQQFQEEHAAKDMQSEGKIKKKTKYGNRLHGHEYAKPEPGPSHEPVSAPVQMDPQASEEPTPILEPKKKGRKKVVKCLIPVKPSIDDSNPSPTDCAPLENLKDDETVTKIMQLLLKYNFQNTYGPKEMAALVQKVRKVISTGVSKNIDNDSLTANIANVLMQNDITTKPPPLTDVCEDDSVNAIEDNKYVSVSKKKTSEEIVSKVPEIEIGAKRKRRAALTAQLNLTTLATDSIIDLDDDDWASQNRIIQRIEKTGKTVNKDSIDMENEIVDTSNVSSIELSDDDVPLASIDQTTQGQGKKGFKQQDNKVDKQRSTRVEQEVKEVVKQPHLKQKPGPASKKLSFTKEANITGLESKSCTKNSHELVPLHPSLLSNDNFIKIVAHTYLSGNPMLDEDAALLAARYSTYKALKEVELTGKSINSGPIYDIAMKILGIDILQKLHTTSTRNPAIHDISKLQHNQETESDISKFMQNAIEKNVTDNQNSSDKAPKEIPKKTIVEAAIKPPEVITSTVNYCHMPMGLIKPVAGTDECILPDDEVIISDNPPDAPLPPPVLKLSPALLPTLARHNSKPLILNKTYTRKTAKRTPVTSTVTSAQPTLVINHQRAATVTVPTVAPTICLDSDEEPAPGPVPVALTSAPASPVVFGPYPGPLTKKEIQDLQNFIILPESNPAAPPPQPPQPPQPPPPLPVASVISNPRQKILLPLRATCKRGDKLRINNMGEIEVVNKDGLTRMMTTTMPEPPPRHVSPSTSPRRVSPSPRRVSPSPCRVSPPPRRVSPPPSANNPLSILQNVVHIQAYNSPDNSKSSSNKPLSKSSTMKVQSANNFKEASPNFGKIYIKPAVAKDAKLKSDTQVHSLVTLLNKHKVKGATGIRKTVILAKSQLNKKNNLEIGSKVIDLTEVYASNSSNERNTMNTRNSSIVVRSAGSSSGWVKETKSTVSALKTNNLDLTKQYVKLLPPRSSGGIGTLNDNKRASTSISSAAPVKKKTKQMTLKDFDLDDIDDIIELE